MKNSVIAKIKVCMAQYQDITDQMQNLTTGDPEERSEGIEKHIENLRSKRLEIRKEQVKYEKQLSVLDGDDSDEDLLGDLFNNK